MLKECFSIGEGRVEDINIEALLSQMRAQIQDAKRSIGLHDLKLLGIFVEEVAVREEEFCHLDLPPCSGQCVQRNQILRAGVVERRLSVKCCRLGISASSVQAQRPAARERPASTAPEEPSSLHELTSAWRAFLSAM